MAIGDDAKSEGYPLVPNTGEDGLVRYGAREINRTRDLVAQVSKRLKNTGLKGKVTISNSNPSGGNDGDIWFKWS